LAKDGETEFGQIYLKSRVFAALRNAILKFIKCLMALSGKSKMALLGALDISCCVLCSGMSLYFVVPDLNPIYISEFYFDELILSSTWSCFVALFVFKWCGLYKIVFRFSGLSILLGVMRAITFYAAIYVFVCMIFFSTRTPIKAILLQPVLLGYSVVITRLLIKLLTQLQSIKKTGNKKDKVLIYGAGSAGHQLGDTLSLSGNLEVVAFLDDDETLSGRFIAGKKIYPAKFITQLVKQFDVDQVLLALPSASKVLRAKIIRQLRGIHVRVQTIPSYSDLITGSREIRDVNELDISDLLDRSIAVIDNSELRHIIDQKNILITGAGGSIGSEISRQVLDINPRNVILVDHSEFALYAIHEELTAQFSGKGIGIVPLLASVADRGSIFQIMDQWRPHTVFHVAAYKHVPLVESNLAAGVSNNIFGTVNVAEAAARSGVSRVILVSTDKAVRPKSVMGATKRVAEMVFQGLAAGNSSTIFSMVRFGNVLESSGSVVPKFRRQISQGGPVTLTHAEVTRYFMTISEAAQLVIQSSAIAEGGDVFVLDMGEPRRIIELAESIIELSGLTVRNEENPFGDIEIKITGLRPGEKLFEEPLIDSESARPVRDKILRATDDFVAWPLLKSQLSLLGRARDENDLSRVLEILHELVPEFEVAVGETSPTFSAQD
jgi:FlaA1/EpsC-like NDP-sugar epimerase